MEQPVQQIHEVIQAAGTAITISAGIGSAVMSFFDQHAAGIGAMVAIAALIINACITIYFKRKEFNRKQ